jgi:general stress protein 26
VYYNYNYLKPAMTHNELNTLRDKIKGIDFAMLTTLEDDGDLHSRPMSTQQMDNDGALWFFTYDDSTKVEEIQRDKRVSITYTDTGSETYVAAAGKAELVKDRAKIDELWQDILKAWFPNGKDDPRIALLKVTLHQAEYWDRPGGKMVKLFQVAKAVVTGEQDKGGRNVKLGSA